ncbi:helix-turn-helix domain-containing protein [Actinoplanes subtropicus]|uniref:helix-turn-helix domain-containing protein n=1 Tax=Actinoplanes subtropicus TaxID=543632 RepID=UPI0004C2BB8F|nr:helix-turn-helix transcriptional regulator [Actinoplanes subtropicus]
MLLARGAEAERDYPYAGLHALLAPMHHLLPDIPPHQAAVLAACLAAGPVPGDDCYTVGAATLSLLTAGPAGRRRLLLIDDLHLMDEVSRRALHFVARRAVSAGIAVIVATAEAAQGHRLEPLGREAVSAVLCDAAPVPPVPPVVDALLATYGGVPAALVEAVEALSPGALTGSLPLPDPMPIGPRALAAADLFTSVLSEPEREALLVAAAADDAGLLAIRAVLAALGLAPDTLEAAEVAGLVTCRGNEVTFTRPLLRCAAYHYGDVALRRRVHQAVAGVTTGACRARHLGLATLGIDESVAAELETAARQPHTGLPMIDSARLLERAAELTGGEADRARRATDAAECWHLAGYADRAHRLSEKAAHRSGDLRAHADAQALLARADRVRGRPELARRALRRESIRLRTIDPSRAAVMLLGAADAESLAGDPQNALSMVALASRMCGEVPDKLIAVRLAAALADLDRLDTARELWTEHRFPLDQVLAAGMPPLGWHTDLWLWYPMLLLRLGEYDEAARLLEELVFQAQRRHVEGLLAGLLALRAELHLRIGAWADAQAWAAEAVCRAERFGQRTYEADARLCLARLAAARGRRDDCAESLALVRTLANGRIGSLAVPIDATEGLMELSLGNAEAAYASLEHAARQAVTHGNGLARMPWLGDYVEAAVRTGRLEEARRLVARVSPRGGSPPLTGVLARCAGLLAESSGESLLREATLVREPFEAARAELLLGESLAARGLPGEAAGPLTRAGDMFDRLAAYPWNLRARRTLDTPARPPTRPIRADAPQRWCAAGLTEKEMQVAALVARGATNREVAEKLFLSHKTIEFHLRGIFRKLGIRTRTELALMLGLAEGAREMP